MPMETATRTRGCGLIPQPMSVYERVVFSDGVHESLPAGLMTSGKYTLYIMECQAMWK